MYKDRILAVPLLTIYLTSPQTLAGSIFVVTTSVHGRLFVKKMISFFLVRSIIFSVVAASCQPPLFSFSFVAFFLCITLSEASCAPTHDFALADELGVELGTIESEKDVKVDTCIHMF